MGQRLIISEEEKKTILGSPCICWGDMGCNYTLVDSFGNLKFVEGDLSLKKTPLSTMYTLRQMRTMVNVAGAIDRL